jgi:anaerobic selenocysteine-containing dehydrogenase
MKPGRRDFLKHAGAGVAGGLVAASGAQTAASQDRAAGANRRVRVAHIGCGGQGTGGMLPIQS